MSERWYQAEACEATLNYLAQGGGRNPLIQLPTGTGKSWVIAGLAQRVYKYFPRQRWIMATVAKELVRQNADKLTRVWPHAPLGVCSASLSRYDTHCPIVYGTIGTLANRVQAIGPRDVMIIDEAQAVSNDPKSTLRRLISSLWALNPHMPVIGLTATGYRMRTGVLTGNEGIFTDVVYDMTSKDKYNQLVDEGFIAKLVTVQTDTRIDASAIRVERGDFSTRAATTLVGKRELLEKSLKEVIAKGVNRACWMVFVPGVPNVELAVEFLNRMGIDACGVHSDMKRVDVDNAVADYQRGVYRCMVVADKLTVGFDHPPIDLIACLRPTLSPIWWIQALGRGARPSPETGKLDCLVLDFTGNTRRVGPVNDPFIPRPAGKKTGEAPIRICDECGAYNHASARTCDHCGAEFPRKYELSETADTRAVVDTGEPVHEIWTVKHVLYTRHEKEGSMPSMCVTYWCGSRSVKEWVPFEHPTARYLAHQWWTRRCSTIQTPATTNEALARVKALAEPTRLRVRVDTRYPQVVDYEYQANAA